MIDDILAKNLEAGRKADNERRCKSGVTVETASRATICEAGNYTSSCNDQSMCGVGLGCIADLKFPYAQKCKWLRNETNSCKSDYECQLDNYCWYKTPQNAKDGKKQCMKMYTMDDYTEFGYVAPSVHTGNDKKITYAFDDNIINGRYCKSAIALIDAASNTMTCVKIADITTNLDAHKASAKKPAKCLYQDGDEDACKYMYKDKTGATKLLQQEYCQCSLMEELTAANKDKPFKPFTLPYSETKKKNEKSDVRERIEEGNGFCPLAT